MDDRISRCLHRNEVGDAELFVELFSSTYCFDSYTRTWYIWEGHRWKEVGGSTVRSSLDEVTLEYEKELGTTSIEQRKALERRINNLNTYSRRKSVIKLVEDKLSREGDIAWDAHPWRMPCENGVINLRNGELEDGRPEDYQRAFCPTTYRGLRVTCPRWDKFLLEIMDGDETMVGYIRRLVGYVLSGTTDEGVFPILWGKGRNGKGTMLEVLGKVLGGFATPVASSLLMEQTYTRSSAAASPDLLRLMGKRLVWANETDEGRKLSTSLVKWLVGGDTITARPLYGKEEITFRPTHTIFLLTNHKPQVNPGDYALWQRLHLIPFKLSFVDDPKDPDERKRDMDLMRRFTKIEDQGILTWAVRGCLEWQEYGLIPPKAIKDAVREYMEDEDDLIAEFIRSEVEAIGTTWTRALTVYQRYCNWSYSTGLPVMVIRKFGSNLAARIKRRRVSEGLEYNLKLKVNSKGGLRIVG